MSGLEVVGLVLGIVPLVISTVKHFNTAASYWKLLANTDHANSEYRKIWNEIENERLLYHQQLRKLLMPLIHTGIFSKDELEEFVLDPQNDFKQSLFVDLALKQRLGATHERYLDITTEIQILSARLLQWLPPEIAVAPQAGQVDAIMKHRLTNNAYLWVVGKLHRQRARVKFAFLRGQQMEVLREISEKTKTLERFLVSSDDIAALELKVDVWTAARAMNRCGLSHNGLRGSLYPHQPTMHGLEVITTVLGALPLIASLYESLRLWSAQRGILVNFNKEHRNVWGNVQDGELLYRLQVQKLLAPLMSDSRLTEGGLETFLLSPQSGVWNTDLDAALRKRLGHSYDGYLGHVEELQLLAWRLLQPLIGGSDFMEKIERSTSKPAPKNVIMLKAYDALEKRYRCESGKLKFAVYKSVRIETMSEIHASIRELDKIPMVSGLVLAEPTRGRLPFSRQSIKRLIEMNRPSEAYMRFHDSPESAGTSAPSDQQVPHPRSETSTSEITLGTILHSCYQPRMQRAQRLQLALRIASSHLQLRSTSWARRHLQSQYVKFAQYGPTATDLDSASISADFEPELPSSQRVPKATDRSFASLGIILLELLFGAQLEEHKLWQHFGMKSVNDPIFRRMVAIQWAKDVEEEAGPDFASAVEWCLNKSPTTLEGNWRRDLAQNVVVPLQRSSDWCSPANTFSDE